MPRLCISSGPDHGRGTARFPCVYRLFGLGPPVTLWFTPRGSQVRILYRPPLRTARPSGRQRDLLSAVPSDVPRRQNLPRAGVLDEQCRTGGAISGMDSLTAFPSAAQTTRRGRSEAEDAVGVTSVRRDPSPTGRCAPSQAGKHRRHVLSILSDDNTLTLRDFGHAPRSPGRSIFGMIFCARQRGGAAKRSLTDARRA